MGSMKGKQEKIDAAFGRIAGMIPSGNLLASAAKVAVNCLVIFRF